MVYEAWPDLVERNVPYYVQIYDLIFQLIQEGKLKPGDSLPGENALASRWDVSRSTVRLAIRKLEEDGYICKMQGKRTTVASTTSHFDNGLQWISNPCIDNCVEPITEVRLTTKFQQSGGYLAKELGYDNCMFVVGVIDLEYFVQETQVASSVCIFHSDKLEKWKVSLDDEEAARRLALKMIYQDAKRSRMRLNAMTQDEENPEVPGSKAAVIMEETLIGEDDTAVAYCKYRVNGDWYRFSIDRKTI